MNTQCFTIRLKQAHQQKYPIIEKDYLDRTADYSQVVEKILCDCFGKSIGAGAPQKNARKTVHRKIMSRDYLLRRCL